MVESVYKFVMEHLQDGSLDKTVAVQLLKKLKSEEDAYTASGVNQYCQRYCHCGHGFEIAAS